MTIASPDNFQSLSSGAEVLLEYDLNDSELISFLLEYEANKLDLEVSRLTPLVAIFRGDLTETIMHRACGNGISHTAYNVTKDKTLTKLVLHSAGIATNRGFRFLPSQRDHALAFARSHNFNVVIKPTHGVRGKGVFTRIHDETSFCSCWRQLETILKKTRQGNILVEERFVGTDFRFFVVDRRVLGVLERQPASLIGDGVSTVTQLVTAKNDARARNPDLRRRLLQVDGIVLANLQNQGLTLESTLPPGERIVLRDNANISTGGDSLDRTDEIPSKVKDLVESAVSAVPGLYTCGVDILAKNIYDDTCLDASNIVVNELEGDAAMGMHHFPGQGKPRNIARAILLTYFPNRGARHSAGEDYRHDFDENRALCQRIAEKIVNLRTPTRSAIRKTSELAVGSLTATELAEIIGGTWLNPPASNWHLHGIGFLASIGRRSLLIPKISSYRYGVDLVGVSPSILRTCALLVDDSFRQPSPLPTLRVRSVGLALETLAQQARKCYQGNVFAITGSVGKTSACRLLYHAVTRQGSCAAPQFGFNVFDGLNTQIVNLSDERFAVFEVAVSALPRCSGTLRPHVAVLTAVAPAHLSYTGTLSDLAERKAGIFTGLEPGGVAVINRAIPFFEKVSDIAGKHARNVVSYGDHPEAAVRLLDYSLELQRVQASVHGEEIEYPLGMNGRHMAVNSLGVLAALQAIGLDWQKAAAEFGYVQLPQGRGRHHSVRIGGRRILIIDDSYNANPASISAALNMLAELTLPPGGRRIAIIGDMLELGSDGPQLHAELAKPILEAGIDRVYVVGPLMKNLWDVLPTHLRGTRVESAADLIPSLLDEIAEGDALLFKGSNAFNLFDVVKALRELDEIQTSYEMPVASAETKTQTAPSEGLPKSIMGYIKGLRVPRVADAAKRSSRDGRATYTLTLCGDTSLGDYYLSETRGVRPVYQRLCQAPHSFFEHVKPLIADSDTFIANLETCLVTDMQSPFAGEKRYLGWDDPVRTLSVLKGIGVTAANLANNHTMDFGAEGLLRTMACLKESGIRPFGAGENRKEASKPFRRRIKVNGHGKAVYVIGAFETSRAYREKYDYYARASTPGVNPLSQQRLTSGIERLRTADPDALIIVCPHWHRNYGWASDAELQICSTLVSAGADLVIGHGAHMLQQCQWSEAGTRLLSLGNFIFNSPGRYAKFLAPPFSLIARLEIAQGSDGWSSILKLYPILTDNLRTDFNVQPVDRAMLASVYSLLAEHDADSAGFRACFDPGEDERGPHIKLNRAISHRFV